MTMKSKIPGLINFTKAAKLLGCSRPTVYKHIDKGRLHPVEIDGDRFLLINEVEQLKEQRGLPVAEAEAAAAGARTGLLDPLELAKKAIE